MMEKNIKTLHLLRRFNTFMHSHVHKHPCFRFFLRNPISRVVRNVAYSIFNFFYAPYLYSFYLKKIKQLSPNTQVFLMTRPDFGTYLILLNYARCWEEMRGKTCIVVLTSQFANVSQLAKVISPKTLLITPDTFLTNLTVILFGHLHVHFTTLSRIYAQLSVDFPNALYIFNQTSSSKANFASISYIPWFDRDLQRDVDRFPPHFLNAYNEVRNVLDYRREIFEDMIQLHYKTDLSAPRKLLPNHLKSLHEALNIKNRPYVVMNLNCKDNGNRASNRRRVEHPERYNSMIDYLIERGYSVVIQGRKEQPLFNKRMHLIDYSKSDLCTVENDIALYSGCDFAVLSKTGPELFGTICNIPILGLNYTELCGMQPNLKMRFYPKHIKKAERYISWKELLQSSFYFDIGPKAFDETVEYVEMEEEEIMQAVKEFIPLVSKPSEEWLQYAPQQQAFKNEIHPFHLDLYNIKAVPCVSYLTSPKSSGSL